MKLSDEQKDAVFYPGNVFVSACPGSGKTRALTARIANSALLIEEFSERVLGLTFTNRAADEIQSRIEIYDGVDSAKVWIGTIHAFALEWIIRPYAGYIPQLKYGFDLADEYEVEKILDALKREHGMSYYDEINTSYNKSGSVINSNSKAELVEKEFRRVLVENKKIDFDQILYFAYFLLTARPDIAITLGAIFRFICVDEVQDTQELQYAILSCIHNKSLRKPNFFIVGDENQAIYQNIGGLSKTLEELNAEFVGSNFKKFHFSDNYRSTQRIIDYFSFYRAREKIVSKADYANHQGKIVFVNKSVHHKDLGEYISQIIKAELESGVSQDQICIIGPQWSSLRALSRSLISILPHIKFDAPTLSPFYGHQDNLWLVVSKLILTTPSGRMYSARMRWAKELIEKLSVYSTELDSLTEKDILKCINSFKSSTTVGTEYLSSAFDFFLKTLKIEVHLHPVLSESKSNFFEKANRNISLSEGEYQNTIDTFRNFFKKSSGVVINSCHGIKGEEYEVVVALGLLRGYIPHWGDIIDQPKEREKDAESKMMYVIASRAKKNLYLIAEDGRLTKSKNPYASSGLINSYKYAYDVL